MIPPGLAKRIAAAVAAGLTAGVATLAVPTLMQLEGRKYVPYRDTGGVWTVCDGITGPAVVPGRRYSDGECDDLLAIALGRENAAINACIKAPLEDHERAAWLLFAHNVGTNAFCRSTAAKLINTGRNHEACAQLDRWVFVAGRDCRIRSNNCYGIVDRRALERAMCEGMTK